MKKFSTLEEQEKQIEKKDDTVELSPVIVLILVLVVVGIICFCIFLFKPRVSTPTLEQINAMNKNSDKNSTEKIIYTVEIDGQTYEAETEEELNKLLEGQLFGELNNELVQQNSNTGTMENNVQEELIKIEDGAFSEVSYGYIDFYFKVRNISDTDINTITIHVDVLDKHGDIVDTTFPQKPQTLKPGQAIAISCSTKEGSGAVAATVSGYSLYRENGVYVSGSIKEAPTVKFKIKEEDKSSVENGATASPVPTESIMPTPRSTSTPSPTPTLQPTPRPTSTPTPIPTPVECDISIFKELSTYKYDEFDKEWLCYGEHIKKYSNATVSFGIQIEGTDNALDFLPYLYTWIYDENNKDVYYMVESIDILVDGTVYSYPKLQKTDSGRLLSYVFMGSNNGKKLIDAMLSVDEISIRLHHKNGTSTVNIPSESYKSSIKPMVQALVEFDVWNYIRDSRVKEWEEAYPLEIR